MNEGAIAFIDCLGWKGIWRHVNAELVIARIEEAKSIAESEFKKYDAFFKLMLGDANSTQIDSAFISDTVVIGICVRGASQLHNVAKGMLILIAAALAQRVAAQLILGNPPLSTRGCVTYGQYVMRNTFIIGEAIDQAAAYHELADGAFIWIPPELNSYIEEYWARTESVISTLDNSSLFERYKIYIGDVANYTPGFDTYLEGLARHEPDKFKKFLIWGVRASILRYPVPLKGKRVVECFVPNPVIGSLGNPSAMIAQCELAMKSDERSVTVKRQNTLRLLKYSASDFDAKREELVRQLQLQ